MVGAGVVEIYACMSLSQEPTIFQDLLELGARQKRVNEDQARDS